MKQILLTKEQLHKSGQAAITEYTNKMKSNEDEEHKYTRMNEIVDVLTLSIAFALLEHNLFDGGESDESVK